MGSNQTQAGLLGECGSLPHGFPRIPRIAKERTAYGRTNASLTRLRGSAQRPAEGKGLDRGFSLRQNLTPNRTARLVISGGSIVTPGATSIMVNPKRKKALAVTPENAFPSARSRTNQPSVSLIESLFGSAR